MRIYVQIISDWMTVSCKEGAIVESLASNAIAKYNKFKKPAKAIEMKDITAIRRTKNSALLDPDDPISLVLIPEEYITLELATSDASSLTKQGAVPNLYTHVECFPKEFVISSEIYIIDGISMIPEDLVSLGKGHYTIKLSDDSINKVKKSRALVDEIVLENKVVYGITTGFGKFSDVIIDKSKMGELQESLIRSHAAGVGSPMSVEESRMMLALRINTLAKGYSGITMETLNKLVDAFNVGVVPWIPLKGSVGASGDLAPLAHLALGLIGEGRVWSPKTGWTDSKHALAASGLSPMKLKAKEGLCLINGTQFITSLGAEALARSSIIAKQADVIAALSLEVLKGTSRAFDISVHEVRPHKGQIKVARRLQGLLHNSKFPSEISESHRFCSKVQDAYTLRCCPQVHGIVLDTIDFVRGILTTEMNSATDNPLVFAENGMIISAGNFHGEYPAKALDYLAIGIHELANMSERRLERLVNPSYSGLPAFLVKDGGLNSGFMIAHVTAAALVSENKVLTHPASVDSLTTSAGQEDHVSMGAFSARKALEVVSNVENVLAIELLAAVQALEFLRPLKSTEPLEAVVRLVRSYIKPLDRDRFMSPDIEHTANLLKRGEVWDVVEPFIETFESSKLPDLWISSPTTTSLKTVINTSGGKKRKASVAKIPVMIKSKRSGSIVE